MAVLEWLVEGEDVEQRFEEEGAAYRHPEDFGGPDWHQHA